MTGTRRTRSTLAFTLWSALVLGACGGGATAPPDSPGAPAAVTVTGGDAQSGAPGMPLAAPIGVRVLDADGRPVPGVTVQFASTAGDGFALPRTVTTDAGGNATTRWFLGADAAAPQQLRASTGGATATFGATLVAPRADSTYRGRNAYIEYTPGTLPLIISAPHGGSLRPAEIPDRTSGTTTTDLNTEELARAVAAAFEQRTGKRPHLVVSRLARVKLDPNRELAEAAAGSVYAEHAWREWGAFLGAARALVAGDGGGVYIDLHGHGHDIPRLELGYLLTGSQLALGDAALDALATQTSIRRLVQGSGCPLSALLRGDAALGTLFENAGYPAVPSRQQPHPAGAPYFNGGYDTERFGSRHGGTVDAVQLEAHYTGVRNTAEARAAFATAFVDVLQAWFATHYGRSLD